MSESTFQIISLLLQSITAVSAVGAVLTAIFIFKRQNLPSISISCSLGSLGRKSGILIGAYNYGSRPIEVSKVGFSIGFIKKRFVDVKPEHLSKRYGSFPDELPPMARSAELVSWDVFDERYDHMVKSYFNDLPMSGLIKRSDRIVDLLLMSFKCWVKTEDGSMMSKKVHRQVRWSLESSITSSNE